MEQDLQHAQLDYTLRNDKENYKRVYSVLRKMWQVKINPQTSTEYPKLKFDMRLLSVLS